MLMCYLQSFFAQALKMLNDPVFNLVSFEFEKPQMLK